jgi:Spy/CpxP family protein refolding chaperone
MKTITSKIFWIWLLAILLAINLALSATLIWQIRHPEKDRSADTAKKSEQCDSKESRGSWYKKMGLTPEQEEQMKALRDEFKSTSTEMFKALNANQQAIFDELNSETPNLLNLEKLTDETGRLHAMMRKASVEHGLAIKEITSPEQYTKMLEMMQEWTRRSMGSRGNTRTPKSGDEKENKDCTH